MIDHILIRDPDYIQPQPVHCQLLVLVDMATTVVAIILNLSVVLALRETNEMTFDHQNFLQLNMVLNNLLICVLVKSFEVVFTGLAAATQQTR